MIDRGDGAVHRAFKIKFIVRQRIHGHIVLQHILEESKRNLYFIAGLVILVFSIALISSLILMRKSIFVPVRSLSKSMRSFTKSIDSPVPKRKTNFSDEITDMESSFYEMTENMREYVDEIKTLTSDKVQVETQLDVARRIQSGLIPMEHFVLGDGCEIYGIEKPARAVGGDFYDIFRLDSDRICVVVGDISGKGVSAALFMVMVKTGIRGHRRSGLHRQLRGLHHPAGRLRNHR